MNPTRLILLSTSALITLLLLIEWNKFSADRASQTSIDRFEVTDQTHETTEIIAINQPHPKPTPKLMICHKFFKLKLQQRLHFAKLPTRRLGTQSLDLAIDLRGGDIVRASLPKFLERLDEPGKPFSLLENNSSRTYIAQSGLIGPDGIDGSSGRATYQYHSLDADSANNATTLTLDWTGNSTSDQAFKNGRYYDNHHYVDVVFDVTNRGIEPASVTPFAQLKRDNSPAPDTNTGFGMQPFLGVALTQPEDRYTKFDFGDIADEPFSKQLEGGWVAMMQHYFVSAWIQNQSQSHYFFTRKISRGDNVVGYTNPGVIVAPGDSVTLSNRLYIGPKDQTALAKLAEYLDLVIDYGFLWWVAKPLFWLLTQIQSLVINWGVAIILLTVVVKLAFFQLSATSYRSMAKMRTVQPKIQAIRDQYADDRNKQPGHDGAWKKKRLTPWGAVFHFNPDAGIHRFVLGTDGIRRTRHSFCSVDYDLSAMDPILCYQF